MDEEDTDLFSVPIRHRPEELHKLCSKTKFSKNEIRVMYRGFKQQCPTGMVDEDSFKHIFSQFFPQGNASKYAHYVFNTIKEKETGKISFENFLDILSKVSRGSTQEKLQWVFGLYDLDGDGLISKTEMVDVVSSIYEMLGRATQPLVEAGSAKAHVEKIFHRALPAQRQLVAGAGNEEIPRRTYFRLHLCHVQLIDTNSDGAVSIDELVQWCTRNESCLQSLDTLDTIL